MWAFRNFRKRWQIIARHKQKTTKKHMNKKMKIVVIGGSGLIGTKLVNILRQQGHEVVAASPSTGVNTLTGEGLKQALAGADVTVDVANAPSWEDKAVMDFFETSGRNLLSAEATTGVRHHVALSVVGTERLLASGYFRAKLAQETLIKASHIPFTIVRATQFFEFAGGIAQFATEGGTVRLPSGLMQPIVSDDVAAALADVAIAEPLNDTVEVAGPEPVRMDELIRQYLSAKGDSRKVITDPQALLLRRKGERSKSHSWRPPTPWPNAFRGMAQKVEPAVKTPVSTIGCARTKPLIAVAIAFRAASWALWTSLRFSGVRGEYSRLRNSRSDR
jgi:uncharacterized protein YbjT (DUF2867 family)